MWISNYNWDGYCNTCNKYSDQQKIFLVDVINKYCTKTLPPRCLENTEVLMRRCPENFSKFRKTHEMEACRYYAVLQSFISNVTGGKPAIVLKKGSIIAFNLKFNGIFRKNYFVNNWDLLFLSITLFHFSLRKNILSWISATFTNSRST